MAHSYRRGQKVKIISVEKSHSEFGSCEEMHDMVGKVYIIDNTEYDFLEINSYSWMPQDIQAVKHLIPSAITMKNSKEAMFDESLIDGGEYGKRT